MSEDHAHVKIAPPVLFLIHLLLAFGLGWLVRLPIASMLWVNIVGVLFVVIGIALPFFAIREFNAAQTTVSPFDASSNVVSSGPYRFTRNPIYLGFICLLIGFPLMMSNYWGLILSPVFMTLLYFLVIRHEEAYLERKFGQGYLAFKSKVRRWL